MPGQVGPGARAVIRVADFDALIVDLDGVVTRTARVHAAAWKAVFDDFLARRAVAQGCPFVPFDSSTDYLLHVDGKPREAGVADFLASRGIELASGEAGDPAERETVRGLAGRKNAQFRRALEEQGVDVFDTTLGLLDEARTRGLLTAVVSSSRNCQSVLDRAGLRRLFEARVDGEDLARYGLRGKPAPDMYQRAAALLGARPERAVVIEDAVAGVRAGRAGGFALVVGVDRAEQAEPLRAAGAHVVVRDLAELRLDGARRLGVRSLMTRYALGSSSEVRQLLEGICAREGGTPG